MDKIKWPEGEGVDLAFWDNRDIWTLRDAAAISLGIDPRVFYLWNLDPAFQGGPKILFSLAVPGLSAKMDFLTVMAENGSLRAFKGEKGWHVRPTDYHAFMDGATVTTPTTDGTETGQPEDPKDYAERLLAKGLDPGQVMLALAELYDDMPKWKAAGLALRRPVVDLDEFERDRLKSRFYDRTKKFRP